MDINIQKNLLIENLKRLSNDLDSFYNKELNFRNHCYLRIAYDCTVDNKWDAIVQKPFIKFATNSQLNAATNLLNKYLIDKQQLLFDNEKSLAFRNQIKSKNSSNSKTLFDL